MQQVAGLAGLRSVDFDIPNLRAFPQRYVENHVREHVSFVELRFGLNLSLEVARRDKELQESPTGFGNDVLLVGRLVGNIDHLQKPCVGKTLHGSRELKHPEVECRLQCEGYAQSTWVRLDVHRYLAEPTGLRVT